MELFPFDLKKSKEYGDLITKDINAILLWKRKYTSHLYCGFSIELCNLLKPQSAEDYYEKLNAYALSKKTLPIGKRGLTKNDLVDLAIIFQKDLLELHNINYTLEQCFYFFMQHAIVDVYNGYKQEEKIWEKIETICPGATIEKVNRKMDLYYGCDLKMTHNDVEYYIQVKPRSFFITMTKESIINKWKLCEKYERLLNDKGHKTYYVIYNQHFDFIKSKKTGKYLFYIDEIFTYDKNDIKKTMKQINYF